MAQPHGAPNVSGVNVNNVNNPNNPVIGRTTRFHTHDEYNADIVLQATNLLYPQTRPTNVRVGDNAIMRVNDAQQFYRLVLVRDIVVGGLASELISRMNVRALGRCLGVV